MKEFQCESCGAIYTLDAGNLAGITVCTCRNRNFKIADALALAEAS